MLDPARTLRRYALLILGLIAVGVLVNWALGSFELEPACDNRGPAGHLLSCE